MSNKRVSGSIHPSAVILLLIVPLCNAVLGVIHSAVSGDIMYTVLADIFSWIMYILTSLSLYGGLGFVVRACVRGFSFVPYAVMYGIGLVLVYAGGIMADKLYMTDEAFVQLLPLTLVTDLLNIGIEAVLFAVSILLVRMVISRYGSAAVTAKNPFVRERGNIFVWIPVGVCFVNSFVWAVASTVVDIVSVGLPINLAEVVYLVSPYLLIAAVAVGGSFAVSAVLRIRK